MEAMMTSTATVPAEPIVLELKDIQDWCQFARDNREALIEECGSIRDALDAALAGDLLIGGGAGPLFQIKFADA
jgi:hypothetical protein